MRSLVTWSAIQLGLRRRKLSVASRGTVPTRNADLQRRQTSDPFAGATRPAQVSLAQLPVSLLSPGRLAPMSLRGLRASSQTHACCALHGGIHLPSSPGTAATAGCLPFWTAYRHPGRDHRRCPHHALFHLGNEVARSFLLVKAEEGVSILPAWARSVTTDGLQCVRLEPEEIRAELVLLWKKAGPSPALLSLTALVEAGLKHIQEKTITELIA